MNLGLTIKRIAGNKEGTFGVLLCGDIPFALTAELPWKFNAINVSCIPADEYQCRLYMSPHFGLCLKIMKVPGRTDILFHKGNIPLKDSRGCVVVGEQFEPLSGQQAVTHSGKGFGEFMAMCKDKTDIRLTIIDATGGAA